jgi:putative ABC transport system ATP-binding protein
MNDKAAACTWFKCTFLRGKDKTMEYAIGAAESNHDFAVRCRGLTKTYGTGDASVMALRGIDLDVRRGELLMLIGPSGCGKTTLISVIAAILDQDSGQCEVLGRDLKRMGERDRTRFRGASIGFVFQLFNLLPALNAVENVAVPLLINGASRKKAEARAEEVLEAVHLGPHLGAFPGQLSGGQQQRVAIARALVHDPKLIVCDEPTSSLDHETGHSVMEILRGVAKSPDRALIVVTHDPRIFEFADRMAHMDDGKIIEVGDGKNKERLQ